MKNINYYEMEIIIYSIFSFAAIVHIVEPIVGMLAAMFLGNCLTELKHLLELELGKSNER